MERLEAQMKSKNTNQKQSKWYVFQKSEQIFHTVLGLFRIVTKAQDGWQLGLTSIPETKVLVMEFEKRMYIRVLLCDLLCEKSKVHFMGSNRSRPRISIEVMTLNKKKEFSFSSFLQSNKLGLQFLYFAQSYENPSHGNNYLDLFPQCRWLYADRHRHKTRFVV